MGNPVNYRGYATSFEGKQLVSAVKTGKNITFAYDENGLRTQKTVNNVTTNYYYNGSVLMSMTKGDTSLLFSYDAAGNVVAVEVQSDSWYIDGQTLYYIRNGQGDITGLINSSGRAVIEYRYDTWGKDCSYQPEYQEYLELQELNPFRYRGYVYDTETGWYYLQSRYYDPAICRFISADILLSTGQGVLGHNTFVYCLNNPVNSLDDEGSISKSNLFSGATLLAIGVTALCAAISIVSCGTAAPLMVAVAAVTIVAATATVANGVSEVVEGFTATSETSGDGFNPMRDVAYGGDQKAYDAQKEFYSTVAQTGATICSVYMAVSGPVCFVAGTQILTDEGSVPIEEIEEGDSVYATDPETRESGFKRVVQTFERETDEIVKVTYDGETVTTTPTHPFYSPQKGWVEAIKLRAGDILVTSNGEYVVVEQVQHELLETPITVYNFEVEDYHTYYVSESAESNDSFVLVHNKCGVQRHHMLSNKNKRFTPQFEYYTNQYGLKLSQRWNVRTMYNHLGRHTNAYHEFMLQKLESIDAAAAGDVNKFLALFGELADYVESHSHILYK